MKGVSRLKIVAGFVLMLGVLLFSLFFVNRQMDRLTRTESDRYAVWDSLATLLKRKDENTLRLLRMVEQAGDSLLTMGDIERIVERHDTVLVRQQVNRRVVTRRDTLRTPAPRKKGFFKRLGEAFVPSKEDTTIQVRVTTEVSTDTVVYDMVNPVDSLREELQAAAHRRREADERTRRRKKYLQRLDRMLNTRIDSLLKGHEQYMLERARREQERNTADRLQAARTVGGIAVGGITLSALFLLLIGRDVARNNRYRRQIEEARARAEGLLAARERMILVITHDFKAPLGTIKGYAGLLDRLMDDPRQRFYLKAMTDSANHLLTLVTDLLELHRLERGGEEVQRVAFCPARLMEEVADSFRPLTDARGLELHTDTDAVLEENFVGVPLRIRQILTNLMSNAVKFTDRGGVTLAARYDKDRKILVTTVVDTGPGMTDAEQERIWGEFARLSGAQGKEGCGLGLSIVHLLVRLLEGQVDVESTPGKGSTFTVRIPLYPIADGRSAEKDKGNGQAVPVALPDGSADAGMEDGKPLKLLLIDDDRLQLQLTVEMLKTAGMEAVACLQVDDLLEALRTERFDVLLTDIQMPAMSGTDLLRLLRGSDITGARCIPVVAVTARADTRRQEMVAQGFAGLLHKPFSLKDLAEELRTSLPDSPGTVTHKERQEPDFGALTAYSGDDRAAAHDILQSFVDETRQAAGRLRQAVMENDAREVAAVAHKMIPLFTLIGADHVVGVLRRLEPLEKTALTSEERQMMLETLEEVMKIVRAGEKRL